MKTLNKPKHLHILAAIMTAILLACGSSPNVKNETDNSNTFSKWDGVSTEPLVKINDSTYEIRSAAQFAAFAQQKSYPANNTYILKTHIDLAGHKWTPIGISSDTYSFHGTFDGSGFIIKGLKLPDLSYCTGLFGIISEYYNYETDKVEQHSIIKNLKIEILNSVISSTIITHAGALAGVASSDVTITMVSVSGGKLSIKSSALPGENDLSGGQIFVGGIVGENYASISQSASNINITAIASTITSMGAGGIAGQNNGSITSCYATGDITAEACIAGAGGIVGYNQGKIISCYASGAITSKNEAVPEEEYEYNHNHSAAGGIAGEIECVEYNTNTHANISMCVALNKAIGATGGPFFTGRIIGKNNDSTLTNNIANKDIKLTQNGKPITNFTEAKHGIGINLSSLTRTTYTSTGTINANSGGKIISGGLGWDPNIWDFPENSYPALKWLKK